MPACVSEVAPAASLAGFSTLYSLFHLNRLFLYLTLSSPPGSGCVGLL